MADSRGRVAYDVVVVGAGPAGLAAASVSAESGMKVLLLDQGRRVGGQIWRHRSRAAVAPQAAPWIDRLERAKVEVWHESTVFDVPGEREFAVKSAQGSFAVEFEHAVLATGARELFLPFKGWTLPWVLGVGGAQALLKEGTTFVGKRVIVGGSGPLLLAAAHALVLAGAHVLMVLEQAPRSTLAKFSATLLMTSPSRLMQGAGYMARIGLGRYHPDSWIVAAEGNNRVEHVVVSVKGNEKRVECDVICAGFGLIPSVEVATLAGCEVRSGALTVNDLQQTSVPRIFGAGEVCGVAGLESALAQGALAGFSIAGRETPGDVRAEVRRGRALQHKLATYFTPRREVLELATSSTVLCRCEDVHMSAVGNFSDWRQLKLQTRAGMGACQGRTCGGATTMICGHNAQDVRPPIFPTSVNDLAGDYPLKS